MTTPASISRLAYYYTRHGLGATIRRIALAVKRALFSNRMVLFYCELSAQTSGPADSPSSLKVERKRSDAELTREELQEIINVSNPKLEYRNMKERFGQGASLWLIRSEDRLAGYRWSLQGRTIEPHYFPLGPEDVHIFDGHIFPENRGRGLSPFLTIHILRSLVTESKGRAFQEVAEWNQAQLSSVRKTPFRRLGRARKWTIFGHTIVCWAGNDSARGVREDAQSTARSKRD